MEVHLKSWKDLDLKVGVFPVFHPCHDQSLVITPQKKLWIFSIYSKKHKRIGLPIQLVGDVFGNGFTKRSLIPTSSD